MNTWRSSIGHNATTQQEEENDSYGSIERNKVASSSPRWIVIQIRRLENISWWWKVVFALFLFLLPSLLATLLWRWVSSETIEWLEHWWSHKQRKQLKWLLYYLIYVSFALMGFPAALFSLGAGYLLGPWWGAIISVIALSTVALTAFVLARYVFYSFFYDVVVELFSLGGLQRWNVVMAHRAFMITCLIRASPLFPFTLSSFLLGITDAPIAKFLVGTSMGTLPEVILLTHVGSLANSLVQVMTHEKTLHQHRWYWLITGLLTSTLVVYLITRIAKKTLQQQLASTTMDSD
ncbi:hypothetical protein GpartN1_g7086.t1 [Galdieria partita]|uniref:VTT domain-containing protein n=1 Tax=Galdieria partita TaxID=83374 RepID=A0A9C7UU74_9RHOD|nr:hypothetical protein GpartN1_g7086.t1 [Galdieria partita]